MLYRYRQCCGRFCFQTAVGHSRYRGVEFSCLLYLLLCFRYQVTPPHASTSCEPSSVASSTIFSALTFHSPPSHLCTQDTLPRSASSMLLQSTGTALTPLRPTIPNGHIPPERLSCRSKSSFE
ncbi:hypothetical protein PLICRDRAFT_480529 [Plicaturopsis crispa FD-325 SS-3]|nr:hypothetical protein PLICRDRAFT_480529 [Plicaturopsis crispa FD-325 SS-3]